VYNLERDSNNKGIKKAKHVKLAEKE